MKEESPQVKRQADIVSTDTNAYVTQPCMRFNSKLARTIELQHEMNR